MPEKTHIIHIHHPSGPFFEAFAAFAEGHSRGNFFQSEAFFRFAEGHAYAEPLLLLSIRQEGLKDPGMRYKPTHMPQAVSHVEALSASVDKHSLTGSLLAIILTKAAHGIWKMRPLRGIYRRLCTRTLIIGGPLLARGSRLENEYTLKALVQTLCQQAQCRTKSTRFVQLFDDSDLLPLFREMGFRWQSQTFPPTEPLFKDPIIEEQLKSLKPTVGEGFGSFVIK